MPEKPDTSTYVAFGSSVDLSALVGTIDLDTFAPGPYSPSLLIGQAVRVRGRFGAWPPRLLMEARLIAASGTPLTGWVPFGAVPDVPVTWRAAFTWDRPADPPALVELRGTRPGNAESWTLPVTSGFVSGQCIEIALDTEE